MEVALDAAKQAYEENEVPVGCIIVKDKHIVAQAHNLMKIYSVCTDKKYFEKSHSLCQ